LLAVIVGEAVDLEVEGLALLGVGAGAVVALVPDATSGRRLLGFLVGVVIALLGYFVRAALLPDTSTGRAVTVALVVLAGSLVAVATAERLRWWTVLLGSATFAGAFETTYAEAPPLVADTSVSTLTTLVLGVAVGFLTVAALTGGPGSVDRRADEAHHESDDEADHEARVDDTMEAVR
jgi:hypothetical protein